MTKYALKNKDLEYVENSPTQMHKRLAKEFARIESKFPNPLSEKEIFSLFDHFKYIVPQGSPMFGIGNPYQRISLSNCFVIDVVDSYGGIHKADEHISQICKRRGGIGLDISALRPKGTPTDNCALTTDGIVVFMERFSNSTREVAQSGRRGALMQSISVHHPEIMSFIKVKRELDKVTGANISVRVSDEFMEAVKSNKTYELRWPVDSSNPSVSQKMKARDVWNELVKSNYLSAEPGILFWDTITRNSPADSYVDVGFKTISTNPCGELPLCVFDSCRLLLINLVSYVERPFTEESSFNMPLFLEHVRIAQRLMDDIVEMELEKIDEIIQKVEKDPENEFTKATEMSLWKCIRDKCEQGRRTGLGITGLGDCLAFQNIKYGSDESLKSVEVIYENLRNAAYRSSIEMAKERGAFPVFDAKKEAENEYLNRLPEDILSDMKKHGRRNIGCLTTAPAGSVSTLTQTTSGFEPVFMASYTRRRKLTDSDKEKPDFIDKKGDKWKEYSVDHHGVKVFKELTGKSIEESPYAGSQAAEIDYIKRVEMQAVATKYVDHAISSTINLPADVDIDTVSKLYLNAWKSGCKGLTVYRSGSRDGVLIESTRECEDCDDAANELVNMITDIVKNGKRPVKIISATAPKRLEVLECDIHRSKVAGGDWLFFVGKLDNQPYEVFGGQSSEFTIPNKYKTGWIRKNGIHDGITQYNLILGSLDDENERLEFKNIPKNFNNYEYGAFTRVISLSLRHGVPIKYICEQITKRGVEGDLWSFQRAMARVLKKYIAEDEISGLECPECHARGMVYKNGCPTCMVCGNSKCA